MTKKLVGLVVLLAFLLTGTILLESKSFAKPAKKTVKKLQTKKSAVKSSKKTKAVKAAPESPEEEEGTAPVKKVETPKNKTLVAKGGYAGGSALLAAEFLMPVGPVKAGGELGYAINTNGSGFSILDLGIKAIYPLGDNFAGLEISYAGYSKDVTEVLGLSGTITSGIGVGLVGGRNIGPWQVQLGYNTKYGIRADAGYCFLI